MKKWLKFTLYILIILTTVVLTSTVVLGYNYSDFYASNSGSSGANQVIDLSENLVGIIQTAGYALAVVLVFVIAIQFMVATPNKKAELKTRSWLYGVGIVLLVAIPTMMDWAAEIGKAIRTGSSGGGAVSAPAPGFLQIKTDPNGSGMSGLFSNSWFGGGSAGNTNNYTSTNSQTQPQIQGTNLSGDPQANTGSGDPVVNPQPSNPLVSSGYIPPKNDTGDPEDVTQGDYIYFRVTSTGNDASGNPILSVASGNWNDDDYRYKLGSNEIIHKQASGDYILYKDGQPLWWLGSPYGGKGNTFEVEKARKAAAGEI